MNLNEVFSQNMKKLRTECSLSQEELAERSGLHRTYISLVERNQRNITLKNLEKIAKGLELPPYLLLVMEDEKNEDD